MIYVMMLVGVAGILLPIWLDRRLKKLLRMDHPLTRMMIQKYSICFKVKKSVNNVDSFVDKYVYSYKIGGLYLSTWDRLCGQLPGALVLISIGMLFIGYLQRSGQVGGQPVELSTAYMGMLEAGLLIFYNSLFGRREKLQRFCYEMKDYLENSLHPKLEQENEVPDRAIRVAAEHTQAEGLIRAVQQEREQKQAAMPFVREQQQDIIDEILLEYLS